jgi:hypothetical protein
VQQRCAASECAGGRRTRTVRGGSRVGEEVR